MLSEAYPRFRSVASRKRYAPFKGSGRHALLVLAAAEEQQQAPAGRAKRTPKREVTVDLAAVKPEDEFEGVVVSSSIGLVKWEPIGKCPCMIDFISSRPLSRDLVRS
jgi:hypothetical protein